MDERTQSDIAEGLKAGSPDAWLRLHEAYGRRVWRDIARLTGADATTVADMVQETFLAAAQSATDFDPRRGPLWTWLWGVARRQAALYYRKAGPATELRRARQWWARLNGQRRELYARAAQAPPELLASRELATLVRAALARLPADYQMLLAAKYMEEQSTAQIASELGLSPAAVDSKLARARHALRRALARIAGSSRAARQVWT